MGQLIVAFVLASSTISSSDQCGEDAADAAPPPPSLHVVHPSAETRRWTAPATWERISAPP
jgi:hypothetical protein